MLISLIRLLIAITVFTNLMYRKTIIVLFARKENSCLTKSVKTFIRFKAVITFNQVAHSPSIKSIRSLTARFVNLCNIYLRFSPKDYARLNPYVSLRIKMPTITGNKMQKAELTQG